MLTCEAVNQVINCSMDLLRERLRSVPLDAEQLARIYGFDEATAKMLADECSDLNDLDPMRVVNITATFADETAFGAVRAVSEWMAGTDQTLQCNCYSPGGSYVLITIATPPQRIGTLHARQDVDGSYIFRMVASGEEEAFDRGEPVRSELFRCSGQGYAALDEVYASRDPEGFAQWKAKYCTAYASDQTSRRQVMHVQCRSCLTPVAIHEISQQPECTLVHVDVLGPAPVAFKY